MRIAYVCTDPGVPVFGTKGASVHVQEVVRVLVEAGHTVDLFCRRQDGAPRGALARAEADSRLTIVPLPRPTTHEPAARERELIAGERDLAQKLSERHDRRLYDAVYERYALFGRAAMRFARLHGIPGILEVNAPLPLEQRRHRVLVHDREAHDVARSALSDATVAVCVSQDVAAWAEEQAPQAHVRVVPNGVDTARFRPRAREQGEALTIGFVGTLKPWHGTDVLVDAFARFVARREAGTGTTPRLVLIGDGPERSRLQERVGALGIPDLVDFRGAVAPHSVPDLLSRVDIGVAPYPAGGDAYFSPMKVLEYMAAGLAVVASEVGQVPELVEHGRAGVLVPGSDPAALAAAFALLEADPARRGALGGAAREAVTSTRTWRHVVARSFAAAGLRVLDGEAGDGGALPRRSPAEAVIA